MSALPPPTSTRSASPVAQRLVLAQRLAHRHVGEPVLFGAVDDLDVDSRAQAHAVQEGVAVQRPRAPRRWPPRGSGRRRSVSMIRRKPSSALSVASMVAAPSRPCVKVSLPSRTPREASSRMRAALRRPRTRRPPGGWRSRPGRARRPAAATSGGGAGGVGFGAACGGLARGHGVQARAARSAARSASARRARARRARRTPGPRPGAGVRAADAPESPARSRLAPRARIRRTPAIARPRSGRAPPADGCGRARRPPAGARPASAPPAGPRAAGRRSPRASGADAPRRW